MLSAAHSAANATAAKAPRWQVSPEQQAQLEKTYTTNRFPTSEARKQLAAVLNATPLQVQVWFQNRRQRERRMAKMESASHSSSSSGIKRTYSYDTSKGMINNFVDTSSSRLSASVDLPSFALDDLLVDDNSDDASEDKTHFADRLDGVEMLQKLPPLPLQKSGCSDLFEDFSVDAPVSDKPHTKMLDLMQDMTAAPVAATACSTECGTECGGATGPTAALSAASSAPMSPCIPSPCGPSPPCVLSPPHASPKREHTESSSANAVQVITQAAPPYNVIYVSDGWKEVCGYGSDEAVGKTLKLLQGPRTDPAAIADLMTAVDQHVPAMVELINYAKNGRAFSHKLHVEPLRDASGTVQFLQANSTSINFIADDEITAQLGEEEDTAPVPNERLRDNDSCYASKRSRIEPQLALSELLEMFE